MAREFDLGKHPFPVTWSGYSPGAERQYSEEDRRNFVERFLNPEGVKRAGIFLVRRWVWTTEESLTLDGEDLIRRGEIYYDLSFGEGNYQPTDFSNSNAQLARMLKKDERVKWMIGITWLASLVKRYGWKTSDYDVSLSGYSFGIKSEVERHISKLRKKGNLSEAEKLQQRLMASADRYGGVGIKLVYISRDNFLRMAEKQ